MTIRTVPETSGTSELSYVTYHLGRVAICDCRGWDVFGDHTSSTDDAVFSNDYSREHGAINAYLSSFFNTGSLHALVSIRAARMNIVSQSYPGSQENIILDDSELGDIDFVVNLNAISYPTTVVYDRVVPDTDTISDVILFSDDHIMTSLQVAADVATTVDDSTVTNMSPGANG